jgi:4-amino-4-deoxy-L-arabinose transferase-like glycosyltransferase
MSENKILRIIVLFALTVLLWSYFAGLPIDVTRDAGKYATISKEMLQNKEYINLTVHGDAYDQKPPLLFWLGALGFSIGSVSNFWFKFPVLLIVFAGFYWAYQLGKSLYNKRVGILTATFLSFSVMYILYSMDIHTDTLLQAFITLALWQLFEFIKTRKNIHWILGFTGIGFAMLSKGPVGAAIPAFAVVGHILLKKDYRFLIDIRWYLGIVLALIIVSPAFIGLMNQFGWEGIRFFFWENNMGRITGTYIQAKNDPFFFLHNLAYLFLPWALLFFISTFFEFKKLLKNKFRSAEYFTLTGIWIYFLIISISKNQAPNYIFGIIPLISVLTAKWTDIALESKSEFKIFNPTQNFVVAVLWLMIFTLNLYLFPTGNILIWTVTILSLMVTLFIFLRLKNPVSKIMAPSLVTFACLAFILNVHAFPFIFSHQAPPKAARYFTESAGTENKLYNFGYGQYELYFYSDPQATLLKTTTELKNAAEKPGSWIFTDPAGMVSFDSLQIQPDTIIAYQHLYLNRGGRFINPNTRDKVLQPMYLIKMPN